MYQLQGLDADRYTLLPARNRINFHLLSLPLGALSEGFGGNTD
ncbi:hypothetical protein [Fodinicurvata sediminis]|nr:hypothetical protein [Fodinicurvata sediminis]